MLGWKVATPVFDGATDKEIEDLLEEAGLRRDGKTILYDGRTGEPFGSPVTVGVMYMLLHMLLMPKLPFLQNVVHQIVLFLLKVVALLMSMVLLNEHVFCHLRPVMN